MIIAPLQAFGIGDIIFCQTLAQDWIADGHKVVWGAEPYLVEGLQRAYPQVQFENYRKLPIDYNAKHEHDTNVYRVIPLRWADYLLKVPYHHCMRAKYDLFKRPFSDWRRGAVWQRSPKQEAELLDLLKLPKRFIFVNETYQTGRGGHRAIIPASDLPIIKLKYLPQFSLFDWMAVVELAEEIHTVSTSLFYLLEVADLKQPIHLYARNNDPNFSHISYLFTKHYELHR